MEALLPCVFVSIHHTISEENIISYDGRQHLLHAYSLFTMNFCFQGNSVSFRYQKHLFQTTTEVVDKNINMDFSFHMGNVWNINVGWSHPPGVCVLVLIILPLSSPWTVSLEKGKLQWTTPLGDEYRRDPSPWMNRSAIDVLFTEYDIKKWCQTWYIFWDE